MPLSNAGYDAIMREYDKRRAQGRRVHDGRVQEVYARVPGIKSCDQQIAETAARQAEKLLNGDAGALQAMQSSMRELEQTKAKLLADAGFPEDYLEPVYTCARCKDTGYVGGRKCQCLIKAEIGVLYGASNIGPQIGRNNFGTLDFGYYSRELTVTERGDGTRVSQYEYMVGVVDQLRAYSAGPGAGSGNLLFTGPTGTGKTFMAECVAKELLDQAYSVIYLSAVEFFNVLSVKRFDAGGPAGDERYRGIFVCDLLVIDDLGTELQNSFTNSELFNCLNERLLGGKATLISTNLSMNEIRDTYSERIFSRIISGYRVIRFYGDDIRIKKRLEASKKTREV